MNRAVVHGDPARRIVAYAAQRDFGLTMMPTHGYGVFRKAMMGSVTSRVLDTVDCPVWQRLTIIHAIPMGQDAAGIDGLQIANLQASLSTSAEVVIVTYEPVNGARAASVNCAADSLVITGQSPCPVVSV